MIPEIRQSIGTEFLEKFIWTSWSLLSITVYSSAQRVIVVTFRYRILFFESLRNLVKYIKKSLWNTSQCSWSHNSQMWFETLGCGWVDLHWFFLWTRLNKHKATKCNSVHSWHGCGTAPSLYWFECGENKETFWVDAKTF